MQPLAHEAWFYRGRDEFLAGTVPFIEVGLSRDEPVLVATPPAGLAWLREAMAGIADRATMVDICSAGRNPGRILPQIMLRFANSQPGRRVRIVGESVWPGRSHLEYRACVQHEALINAALDGRDTKVFCPYDRGGLGSQALADAERTHPVLGSTEGTAPSARHLDPATTVDSFSPPLPAPPTHAAQQRIDLRTLGRLRSQVVAHATAAGLPPERVMDATIAVNELACNTIDHTGGPGTVATWREDGRFVCQVTDRGHITDPLAGRIPAPPEATSGRGLLVVHDVSDLVLVHTRPGRTTIRIQFATEDAGAGSAASEARDVTGSASISRTVTASDVAPRTLPYASALSRFAPSC